MASILNAVDSEGYEGKQRTLNAARASAHLLLWLFHRVAGVLSTLTAAVSAQEGSKKGNTVLVVDEDALTILNACIPPDDLIRSGFISALLVTLGSRGSLALFVSLLLGITCLPRVVSAVVAVVAPLENEDELSSGKRRPKHEALDVLYFMRPTRSNLDLIIKDYEAEVEPEERDFMERCMPCLFKGIRTIEPEAPWYADCRLITLPDARNMDAPYDYGQAKYYLETMAKAAERQRERLWRCVAVCSRTE